MLVMLVMLVNIAHREEKLLPGAKLINFGACVVLPDPQGSGIIVLDPDPGQR
jgi:hypothetical protein